MIHEYDLWLPIWAPFPFFSLFHLQFGLYSFAQQILNSTPEHHLCSPQFDSCWFEEVYHHFDLCSLIQRQNQAFDPDQLILDSVPDQYISKKLNVVHHKIKIYW